MVTLLRCAQLRYDLAAALGRYGLQVVTVAEGEAIPGSYWGPPEAGLIGNRLYIRPDTPAHSALHEACHFICMSPARRTRLHTDAGGDYAEEDAVCYLQVLLGGKIPGLGRELLMRDMDAWGYTFRLGSARAWFDRDAEDARAWLVQHQILEPNGAVTWQLANEDDEIEPGGCDRRPNMLALPDIDKVSR